MPSPLEFKSRNGDGKGYCNSRKDELAIEKFEDGWFIVHLPSGFYLTKCFKPFKTSTEALSVCAMLKVKCAKELAALSSMTLQSERSDFQPAINKLLTKIQSK